jgi:hypothetical protein
MLGGDAAEDTRAGKLGAPQLLQGVDLVGQLAQGLVDQLGFAAGAGGAQDQAAGIEVEGGGRQRLAIEAIELVQPQIGLRAQALAALCLGIGRQQHGYAGAPGTEQGDGQLAGILQVQRHALHTARLQGAGQAQGALLQLGVVERRRQRHGAAGQGV